MFFEGKIFRSGKFSAVGRGGEGAARGQAKESACKGLSFCGKYAIMAKNKIKTKKEF